MALYGTMSSWRIFFSLTGSWFVLISRSRSKKYEASRKKNCPSIRYFSCFAVGESGAIRYPFWSCTYIWKTSARICIKFRHNLATYVAEVHETFHCPSSSYVCGRDETPRQCFMGLVENVGVSWNTYLSHVKVGVCINVPQQYFNKPQWCINLPRSRDMGLSTKKNQKLSKYELGCKAILWPLWLKEPWVILKRIYSGLWCGYFARKKKCIEILKFTFAVPTSVRAAIAKSFVVQAQN